MRRRDRRQVSVQGQGSANVIVKQFSDRPSSTGTRSTSRHERTQIRSANSSSVILNRVTGGLGPSEILGRSMPTQSLPGQPRRFPVRRGAVINTAGFLATTSDIKNDDFMAGRYNFQHSGPVRCLDRQHGHDHGQQWRLCGLVAPGRCVTQATSRRTSHRGVGQATSSPSIFTATS